MTQKELLYMEDATNHEKSIITIINESLNYLEDPSLVSFMKKELKRHQLMEQKLVSKLEDKANE